MSDLYQYLCVRCDRYVNGHWCSRCDSTDHVIREIEPIDDAGDESELTIY